MFRIRISDRISFIVTILTIHVNSLFVPWPGRCHADPPATAGGSDKTPRPSHSERTPLKLCNAREDLSRAKEKLSLAREKPSHAKEKLSLAEERPFFLKEKLSRAREKSSCSK